MEKLTYSIEVQDNGTAVIKNFAAQGKDASTSMEGMSTSLDKSAGVFGKMSEMASGALGSIGKLGGALPGIVGNFETLGRMIENVSKGISASGEGWKLTLAGIGQGMTNFATLILTLVGGSIQKVLTSLGVLPEVEKTTTSMFERIKTKVDSVANSMVESVRGVAPNITDLVTSAVKGLLSIADRAFETLKSAAVKAFEYVKGVISKAWSAIKGLVSKTDETMGETILANIKAGRAAKATAAYEKISKQTPEDVHKMAEAIKAEGKAAEQAAEGHKSWSRNLAESLGIVSKGQTTLEKFWTVLKEMAKGAAAGAALGGAGGPTGAGVGGIFGTVLGGMSGAANAAKTAASAAAISWGVLVGEILAAFYALKKFFDLAVAGAVTVKVAESYKRMFSDMPEFLDRMNKATMGIVDDTQLMQRATEAAFRGLKPDQIILMFNAAAEASKRSGVSMEESIDGVFNAVNNLQTLGLRKLFGTEQQTVMEQYSLKINKLTTDFDDFDKRQAILNFLVRETSDGIKVQATAMEDLASGVLGLKKDLGELWESVKTVAVVLAGVLVEAVNLVKLAFQEVGIVVSGFMVVLYKFLDVITLGKAGYGEMAEKIMDYNIQLQKSALETMVKLGKVPLEMAEATAGKLAETATGVPVAGAGGPAMRAAAEARVEEAKDLAQRVLDEKEKTKITAEETTKQEAIAKEYYDMLQTLEEKSFELTADGIEREYKHLENEYNRYVDIAERAHHDVLEIDKWYVVAKEALDRKAATETIKTRKEEMNKALDIQKQQADIYKTQVADIEKQVVNVKELYAENVRLVGTYDQQKDLIARITEERIRQVKITQPNNTLAAQQATYLKQNQAIQQATLPFQTLGVTSLKDEVTILERKKAALAEIRRLYEAGLATQRDLLNATIAYGEAAEKAFPNTQKMYSDLLEENKNKLADIDKMQGDASVRNKARAEESSRFAAEAARIAAIEKPSPADIKAAADKYKPSTDAFEKYKALVTEPLIIPPPNTVALEAKINEMVLLIKKIEEATKDMKLSIDTSETMAKLDALKTKIENLKALMGGLGAGMSAIGSMTSVTSFEGEGSTRKPLSEKIQELIGEFGSLENVASAIESRIQFVGASAEFTKLQAKLASVESFFPGLSNVVQLTQAGWTIAQNIPLWMQQQAMAILDIKTAMEQSRLKMLEYNILGNYQHGTPYVPATGLYKLDVGERVTPANQNTTFGNISINVPPGTTQSQARAIADELVKLMKYKRAGEFGRA